MSEFSGFGANTQTFLRRLSENNTKAWFEDHRADYEAYFLAPARDFVVAAGEALTGIAPHIAAEPRVNGSIFRINRDVRFSTDKTPYKDHLDFWFWEGEDKKTAASGFFLRVRSDGIDIGAGAHSFDKDRLARYRDAVAAEESGTALLAAVAALEGAGHQVKGEHYKRLPRGYEVGEDRERLLRFNALWVGADESPTGLGSADFVGYCVERWESMLPVHRWLTETL